MSILVATDRAVLVIDPDAGQATPARGLPDRPTCLAGDPHRPGWAWCGTRRGGVFVSDDGGAAWRPAGLPGRAITAVAVSPARDGAIWAGTEPSQVWRRAGEGGEWTRAEALERLPSSSEWSFPPRPETHHVRWIACHPADPGRVWAAIEAGALVSTVDGGHAWRDRVDGGPYDTHELAIHPSDPERLRVAAGDGYFESPDGGASWLSPEEGLDVRYLRSVAIAPERPDVVLVSAASAPRRAYVAGASDGRLYRREGEGPWERVRDGWPEPPSTIAPLLAAGRGAGRGAGHNPGALWAADERGVHRSDDGGVRWRLVARYDTPPDHLRGLVEL